MPDPVIEAFKKDVDRSLLRENLRLTVEERLRKLMDLQNAAEELARAGLVPRDDSTAAPDRSKSVVCIRQEPGTKEDTRDSTGRTERPTAPTEGDAPTARAR
jgi:hypothetical protein